VVLEQLPKEYPNLVVIEYEIYQQRENAPLLYTYNENYNSGLGIPLIIFNKKEYIAGDRPILNNVKAIIEKGNNLCPLADGSSIDFNKLDINSLPGQPKIWTGQGSFSKGESIPQLPIEEELTLAKVLSLAIVDAINPCALAVLTIMLIAILAYNPQKRRNLLLAGLAFVISVFIMYLIYGLIIVKSFQLIQALTGMRLWLYKILGAGAIILGCLKLKDFFQYKAVCKVSPRVDKIISKVTSPSGAFLVGAFVTIFLLPCTIGPYINSGVGNGTG
jgi:cytochrome c biogenesis protein CcdA